MPEVSDPGDPFHGVTATMTQISTIIHNQILQKGMSSMDIKSQLFPDFEPHKRTRHVSLGCDTSCPNTYDYVMRVILLGDQGVGKSSYMRTLRDHPHVTKVKCKCRAGESPDHLEVEVDVSGGKKALVRLCDTGGQERYRSLTSSYYRGAHGALLMFDLCREHSLESVETWLHDLDNYFASGARLLLGTNCTSQDREVSSQRARAYADHRSLAYLELDTVQCYNVVESLQLIADRIATEMTVSKSDPIIIRPKSPSQDDFHPDNKQIVCLC